MKKFLVSLSIFLAPAMALAVTISTGGVNLVLPSTSELYGVYTTSVFDTLTINNASFAFAMSADQTVKVTSSDRRPFTTDQTGATIACDTDQSSAYFKASGAATFTVTPGTGTCGTSSSGGGGSPSVGAGSGGMSAPSVSGGGGGGGGGSSLPPSPPAPQVLPQVPATIVAQPSSVAQAVSPVFNKDLSLGAKNDDVTRVQLLLAQDKSIYPEGLVTGYFGRLTQNAIRAFQLKYGVIKSASDQGNGRVGPKTRAKLNEIFGGVGVAPISQQPAPSVSQSAIEVLQAQIKALQDQIKNLTPSQAPAPLAPSLIPPPPPALDQIPSWMQLTPIPRSGGSSVVDPSTGL